MNSVYFTDRDLGKQFPRILADAGLTVERHADLFPPDGSDEQWLAYCGTQGRVGITHNSRIRYVPNELAAVRRFGVRLLVVWRKAVPGRPEICTARMRPCRPPSHRALGRPPLP